MQRESTRVVIGQHHIQVLEFSDYLIGLRSSIDDTNRAA